MDIIFIGISGASGAGKSTLCRSLVDASPEKFTLVQLDDYFKKAEFVPNYNGFKNWDHPSSLMFDQLLQDLFDLSEGKSIKVWTKNEKLNPEYKNTNMKLEVVLEPKKIVLVEGYLILHDPRIRKFFKNSIWLDISQEESWGRRVHFKDTGYLEKVLLPMNRKFVQPSMRHASHMVDVTNLTKEQVFDMVQTILN